MEVKGDTDSEPDEVFFLELSNAVNATIGMGTAEGRIVNDDVEQHTLTVTVDGGGTGAVTSDPAGIDCPGDCDEDYPAATLVTLTATPELAYQCVALVCGSVLAPSTFEGWGGACASAGLNQTCTVTMDQARHATATFAA